MLEEVYHLIKMKCFHTGDADLWQDESPASTRVREDTLFSPIYTVHGSNKQINILDKHQILRSLCKFSGHLQMKNLFILIINHVVIKFPAT